MSMIAFSMFALFAAVAPAQEAVEESTVQEIVFVNEEECCDEVVYNEEQECEEVVVLEEADEVASEEIAFDEE